MSDETITYPVIFFDGYCGLCDRSVQFFIKHNKKRTFRYATLQSDFARNKLGNKITYDSFILYEKGKVFYRSTAALKAMAKLGGLWPLVLIFLLVPPFIRNGVYNFIARNRYKWFGKYESCRIPSPEERILFIS